MWTFCADIHSAAFKASQTASSSSESAHSIQLFIPFNSSERHSSVDRSTRAGVQLDGNLTAAQLHSFSHAPSNWARASVNEFRGGYCYFAAQWGGTRTRTNDRSIGEKQLRDLSMSATAILRQQRTVAFLNYNRPRRHKMDIALKIVAHLPLRELWRDDGLKTTARIKSLSEDDIRSLLRSGPIQFVVVVLGAPPCWIQPSECFHFWKIEAQPHLAGEARVILDELSGAYCYFASQWDGGDREAPVVVLEKHH
jgi:hypothetical protein